MEYLNFADDRVLLLHTQSEMQKKTDKLNQISINKGLSIHVEKYKVLMSDRVSEDPITLENAPLEGVESFTYLGSIIDKKGGTEADINARISKNSIYSGA